MAWEDLLLAAPAVYVLVKIGADGGPDGVEDEVYAFAAGEFGGGDKIAVARNEDDLIGLLLESEGGDVETDAHIDTLLRRGVEHILFLEVSGCDLARQKLFQFFRTGCPVSDMLIQVTETKRDFALTFEVSWVTNGFALNRKSMTLGHVFVLLES